jgi:hypothetical protein
MLKNSVWSGHRPSAAEAATDLTRLTARLKAAPCQNRSRQGVFPQPARGLRGGELLEEHRERDGLTTFEHSSIRSTR